MPPARPASGFRFPDATLGLGCRAAVSRDALPPDLSRSLTDADVGGCVFAGCGAAATDADSAVTFAGATGIFHPMRFFGGARFGGRRAAQDCHSFMVALRSVRFHSAFSLARDSRMNLL